MRSGVRTPSCHTLIALTAFLARRSHVASFAVRLPPPAPPRAASGARAMTALGAKTGGVRRPSTLAAAPASSSNSDLPTSGRYGRPFVPPASSLRALLAGAGSDGLAEARFAEEIVGLVPPASSQLRTTGAAASSSPGDDPTVRVLYLGTASYDLPDFRERQTSQLARLGCEISSLDVSAESPPTSRLREAVGRADIIVAAGGNTLHAVDRWTKLGMVSMIREASERGCVLAGGSAGAIWAFSGGHSDSADPDSYRESMMERFGGTKVGDGAPDESSAAPADGGVNEWSYIRAPGLNLLPGLLCPHHDRVQSNGVLRADDFDGMLLRHDGERGIGIDHYAALLFEGTGRYRVVSLDDRQGSVARRGATGDAYFCPDRTGKPGVWVKEVVDGKIEQWLVPSAGKVSDLLRFPSSIVEDTEAIAKCRRANPDIAPPS